MGLVRTESSSVLMGPFSRSSGMQFPRVDREIPLDLDSLEYLLEHGAHPSSIVPVHIQRGFRGVSGNKLKVRRFTYMAWNFSSPQRGLWGAKHQGHGNDRLKRTNPSWRDLAWKGHLLLLDSRFGLCIQSPNSPDSPCCQIPCHKQAHFW